MAGTSNTFERTARREKVLNLTAAVNGYVNTVAGGDREARLDALGIFLIALSGGTNPFPVDPWKALIDFCADEGVKVRYPSDESKGEVVKAIRDQIDRELGAVGGERTFARLSAVQ